ncbi:MAG: flagellar hook-associated protein FlgL [Candidatus Omnitrophota bacterium]
MRPVESNWYRDFIFNLTNTKTRYDKTVSETTSGKKLTKLSDNPSDMAYVLSLRSKINQIEQFDKNIESGLSFLNTAKSALSSVQNELSSIIGIAEQGASETIGASERLTLANQVDQIRDQMLNYANTEIMGKYVFSGSATDTPPYTKGADVLVGGVTRPGTITYNGNDEEIEIQADFSVTVSTNTPGSQIFGNSVAAQPPYDIFARMADLVQHLRSNDTTSLGNDVESLHELVNQLSGEMGNYGNRTAHLGDIKTMLKSFKSSIQAKISSLEDANMAESISNLSREEVALQAALQSGSRIQRYTLMNYMS